MRIGVRIRPAAMLLAFGRNRTTLWLTLAGLTLGASLLLTGCGGTVGGTLDVSVIEAFGGEPVVPKLVCVLYYRQDGRRDATGGLHPTGEPVALLRPSASKFEVHFPARSYDPSWLIPVSWGEHAPQNQYALFCFAEGHLPCLITDYSTSSTGSPEEVVFLPPPQGLLGQAGRGRVQVVMFRTNGMSTPERVNITHLNALSDYLPFVKGCLDLHGNGVSCADKLWAYGQLEDALKHGAADFSAESLRKESQLLRQYSEECVKAAARTNGPPTFQPGTSE